MIERPAPPESAPAMMSNAAKTKLTFQLAAHQGTTSHDTEIVSVQHYDELDEADKALFKRTPDAEGPVYALATESTIFHPQGGGQPSDVGRIVIATDHGKVTFEVRAARMSVARPGTVSHFGRFTSNNEIELSALRGRQATQTIDAAKRLLYSRLHTAGHVLGAATRNTLESRIANFDELKASHFPDSAACEFQGLIDGKYKAEVQAAVDELVGKDAEVRIDWWTKEDFRSRGLERLLPDDETWAEIAVEVGEDGTETQGHASNGDEKTRIRVVNIVGAEVYPCGGTHVPTTKGCGKVTVRKISRQKGNSRISYLVD